MKIELRKFNAIDYFGFLRLTLDKNYSEELDNNFFGYIFTEISSLFSERKNYRFAILVNNRVAGSVGLFNTPEGYELGYIILKEFRSKGVASKAAKKTLDFGFSKLKLNKIVAVTDIDNGVSQKILKKLGFKKIKENKKEKEFIWEKRKESKRLK